MKNESLGKSLSTSISNSSVEEAKNDERVEYLGRLDLGRVLFGSPWRERATLMDFEGEKVKVWGQSYTQGKLTSDSSTYIEKPNGKVIELRNEPHEVTNDEKRLKEWKKTFGDLPKHDMIVEHN